jgi:hypothetical protein
MLLEEEVEEEEVSFAQREKVVLVKTDAKKLTAIALIKPAKIRALFKAQRECTNADLELEDPVAKTRKVVPVEETGANLDLNRKR